MREEIRIRRETPDESGHDYPLVVVVRRVGHARHEYMDFFAEILKTTSDQGIFVIFESQSVGTQQMISDLSFRLTDQHKTENWFDIYTPNTPSVYQGLEYEASLQEGPTFKHIENIYNSLTIGQGLLHASERGYPYCVLRAISFSDMVGTSSRTPGRVL